MDHTANRDSDLGMTSAVQGLQLSKQDAMRSLTDFKGNAIEFEEKEDGTIISKAVEGDNYTYTYSLIPQTTIVTVSVAKEPKKKAEDTAKTSTTAAEKKQSQQEEFKAYKKTY